jgi:hypothetical protein
MQDGSLRDRFVARGWLLFDTDPVLLGWVKHALPAARLALIDPAFARWLECGGTWFVGVDALPNDESGTVGASGPLGGDAVDFISEHIGAFPTLHRGQVSVTYPGYPQPRRNESEAGFRYRRKRDAAHVDGVIACGPGKRRQVREPHAFILGLPLSFAAPDSAPLVVWERSHLVMQRAFQAAFAACDPADMAQVDVTDVYVAARRTVFETCARVPLPAQPGQAILLHRMLLHGVASWAPGADDGPDGRMIAYFRPQMQGGVRAWINDP